MNTATFQFPPFSSKNMKDVWTWETGVTVL